MGRSPAMRGNGRFVYGFDEPSEGGRELLGGKGIGLAEMTQLGVPVPAGFTITTDACRAYMRERPAAAGRARRRGRRAPRRGSSSKTGKRFGDSADPLLVSVRSGAAVSMPGMMDTILNLGLNDEAVEGLATRDRQPPLRVRLVPPPDPDVRRGRRRASTAHRFEHALADAEAASAASQQDTELDADDLARARRRPSRRIYDEETGAAFPQDAREQLGARRARGLRVVGHAARAGLPAGARDPRRPRHRGQRRPDGVRQQRRALGHRRRVHARPVDRRARASTASSSRTRRARTSSPASARRSRSRRCTTRLPEAFDQLLETMQQPRGALPRHAGHRVHGRGRQALPAPDAHGEAHGRGRAEGRGRHGRRGPDLARGGRRAHRPGASSTSCCIRCSTRTRELEVAAQGPERLARRRVRRGRLRRRHGRASAARPARA